MSPEQARIAAIALIALTAVLVGFHGASTLLTVTQLGVGSTKAAPPKPHASLVPQPPVPTIKPSEPVSPPAPRASEPAPDEPAPASTAASDTKASPTAADTTPMPTVPDNQVGVAAAAKAQARAEMEAMGGRFEQDMPPPEQRRRYRAPRQELHKVY